MATPYSLKNHFSDFVMGILMRMSTLYMSDLLHPVRAQKWGVQSLLWCDRNLYSSVLFVGYPQYLWISEGIS